MDCFEEKLERITPEELENYAKVYYRYFLKLANKYYEHNNANISR